MAILDPYLLWQQHLIFFWRCWDGGWQLPDVRTAVQVACYITPPLPKGIISAVGEQIFHAWKTSANNLKQLSFSHVIAKESGMQLCNQWRASSRRWYSWAMSLYKAGIWWGWKCGFLPFLDCGSCPGQGVQTKQLPSRTGQSFPRCVSEQLMHSTWSRALANAPWSGVALRSSKGWHYPLGGDLLKPLGWPIYMREDLSKQELLRRIQRDA